METKQIIVLAVALLFILSSFFIGGSFVLRGDSSKENISGQVVFEGIIRTYDPVLYTESNISSDVVDELRGMEGVDSVVLDGQVYTINTETRDDVYPVAEFLRSKGIDSITTANIVAPNKMEMNTGIETINVTFSQGAIRVITEPLIDAGEPVTVSMLGVAEDGFIVGYGSATIVFSEKPVELTATIMSTSTRHIYEIPWEDRNLDVEGEYKKVDSLLFDEPLDLGQIMTMKQLDYIEYIDANSAQVRPDFDNKTKVEEDFGDIPVRFPSSTLITEESLDLEGSTLYTYSVVLESEEYTLKDNETEIETTEEYEDSFNYSATAVISGDTIISIRPS